MRVLIIGTGPAAAGAALALSRYDDLAITVLDIGARLEGDRQLVVERLASLGPELWEPASVERISSQPARSQARGVPEKRSFGSDYPFRNFRQLDGLTVTKAVTASLVSGAYGGFSNVWGSQVLPFTESAFRSWPFDASAMQPHYQAILDQIPYAAADDDLAGMFPLLHRPDPLPPLSERSRRTLDAYGRNRARLNARGITIGKARLAFRAAQCVRCGLCMTGCPYGLIYSAAQTFDDLTRSRRVTLHRGLMALEIVETEGGASVLARELASGRDRRFEADRVFVACGAVGTTRLVARSLELFDTDLRLLESQQFILPVLSLHPSADPRSEPGLTLNQFNLVLTAGEDPADIAQLHFYTFNPAFTEALPPLLRRNPLENVQAQVLRRLSVALGYLPSWHSPALLARVSRTGGNDTLPDMHLSRAAAPRSRNRMLLTVMARLTRSAPVLDLYPLLPLVRLAAGGKSYHFGGSFPHSTRPSGALTSDRLGRVKPWRRVHLVDASVFPSIPAMTFTLTIMANAHRIACETMESAP